MSIEDSTAVDASSTESSSAESSSEENSSTTASSTKTSSTKTSSTETPTTEGHGDRRQTSAAGGSSATTDRPRVVGVLLAAGTGTRFEDDDTGSQGPRTKLVATLQGDPLVRHAGRTMAESGLEEVVVVLGDASDLVTEALSGLGLSAVRNPEYHRGQSTSLRKGVRAAVSMEADAAVFALGDMPLVDPATVDRLVEVHAAEGAGIVVPTYDDRRGNPVLFDRMHFENLAHVTGDSGGRRLFEDQSVREVPVEDPGIHEDVDTVDDLMRLRDRLSSNPDQL